MRWCVFVLSCYTLASFMKSTTTVFTAFAAITIFTEGSQRSVTASIIRSYIATFILCSGVDQNSEAVGLKFPIIQISVVGVSPTCCFLK